MQMTTAMTTVHGLTAAMTKMRKSYESRECARERQRQRDRDRGTETETEGQRQRERDRDREAATSISTRVPVRSRFWWTTYK